MVGSVRVGAGTRVSSVDINGDAQSLPNDFVAVVLAENDQVGKEKAGEIYREHNADDEITGEREAYTASILETYERSLVERTKYHL
ncbi:hypothetical protein MKW92_001031, partial [Papaver armeniacum]